MKKIISSILIPSLLFYFYGCYYRVNDHKEIQTKRPEAFVLVLKDGSEIDCDFEDNPEAFFVKVNEPSDFVFGRGTIFDKNTRTKSEFWGKIERDMIDSTKIVTTDDGTFHLFWLKDNTRISFKPRAFFDIKPEDGKGYWISGKKENYNFNGKVDFADVSRTLGKNTSAFTSMGTVALMVLAMVSLSGIALIAWAIKK